MLSRLEPSVWSPVARTLAYMCPEALAFHYRNSCRIWCALRYVLAPGDPMYSTSCYLWMGQLYIAEVDHLLVRRLLLNWHSPQWQTMQPFKHVRTIKIL